MSTGEEGRVGDSTRTHAIMTTVYVASFPWGKACLATKASRDAAYSHISNVLVHDRRWGMSVRPSMIAASLPAQPRKTSAAPRAIIRTRAD